MAIANAFFSACRIEPRPISGRNVGLDRRAFVCKKGWKVCGREKLRHRPRPKGKRSAISRAGKRRDEVERASAVLNRMVAGGDQPRMF